MNIAYLFPGQGAQYVGMGKDLFEYSPAVRELFEIGSDAGKLDLAALLFSGSEESLRKTDNTQIAVTLVNLAAAQVLADFGVHSTVSAGFSLGEYSALVDAGVLSRNDALTLVVQRGQIMERVSRHLDGAEGPAGMMAVMGHEADAVKKILQDAGVEEAYPSLANSPVQTVVGGSARGLAAARDALKAAGVRKMIPLKVSGPFHTPLMAEAREAFSRILEMVAFSEPAQPVYSNVTGSRIMSSGEARQMCLDQLVTTVSWVQEQRQILADGADVVLEVGPGKVLQGLWTALGKTDSDWPGERCHTAGTLEEIEKIALMLEKEEQRVG
ncbi:[acyl-carrier-protein] S-malonyltransferase [Alkalispirochaeta americana]|uniref:Malonyl CoA-acyl carrier protein transacylase n=1 Tax=Alkalispirochaeta americana TaxID=159291 RepID=A0A1N6V8H9_9SPIO|nr:ACP S-malonyltransferase [Alkalispirochaeta americana]SIQ74155.1 [acyl-carrier-protein] S-malonyltransferase [Alkalispirochaeta americana]